MNRTKGGLNTKLHAAVDGRCQPQSLILTAGTEADVAHAPALLKNIEARVVIMNNAFDSDALRDLITQANMKASIPRAKAGWHLRLTTKQTPLA